jgi:hypothetical protein
LSQRKSQLYSIIWGMYFCKLSLKRFLTHISFYETLSLFLLTYIGQTDNCSSIYVILLTATISVFFNRLMERNFILRVILELWDIQLKFIFNETVGYHYSISLNNFIFQCMASFPDNLTEPLATLQYLVTENILFQIIKKQTLQEPGRTFALLISLIRKKFIYLYQMFKVVLIITTS